MYIAAQAPTCDVACNTDDTGAAAEQVTDRWCQTDEAEPSPLRPPVEEPANTDAAAARSAGCQVEVVRSVAWADIDSWLDDQIQAPSPATSSGALPRRSTSRPLLAEDRKSNESRRVVLTKVLDTKLFSGAGFRNSYSCLERASITVAVLRTITL